jgi:hypothetical protein
MEVFDDATKNAPIHGLIIDVPKTINNKARLSSIGCSEKPRQKEENKVENLFY